ncbi:MAG: hypothetical protein ACQGVC_07270 [Myxococcota bacterium]
MSSLGPPPATTLRARLLDRAEEWIYDLNERGHWLFSLYDGCNELWASLVFRGVKRRAAALDERVEGRDGEEARIRLLRADDDDEAFARLLEGLGGFPYRPPHPLDRAAAERALRRRSYLPFGIFYRGELVGYLLVRLFFPRRAVTAIWSLEIAHNKRFSLNAGVITSSFTRSERLDDYITVPLDNTYSLKAALGAGWEIVRKNRRFYVLLHP